MSREALEGPSAFGPSKARHWCFWGQGSGFGGSGSRFRVFQIQLGSWVQDAEFCSGRVVEGLGV